MKTFKVYLASLLTVGMLVLPLGAQQSSLIGGSNGLFTTQFRSTFTVINAGPCVLMRIDLSSGLTTAANWAQVIDTTTAVGQDYVLVSTAFKVTPPVYFQVNPSSSATNQGIFKDYSPYGLRLDNGLAIYKDAANSGEAITGTAYWRN